MVLSISGCSDAKEQLGLTRTSPDEFSVIKRAPLEMPPNFKLQPPRPGVSRPQEKNTDIQAREAIFGQQEKSSVTTISTAESILLEQTGGNKADDSIRDIIDQETATLSPKEEPVAKKLLGWAVGDDGKPHATIVDAAAEAERIKKNREEGRPITEGETPNIEE